MRIFRLFWQARQAHLFGLQKGPYLLKLRTMPVLLERFSEEGQGMKTRWRRPFYSPFNTWLIWYWIDIDAERASQLATEGRVVRLYSEGKN